MANEIKLKRSSTASAVPTTGDLALGELGINTYDGKLFLKKDDGAASIVEIGGGDVTKVGTPVDNQIGVWTGDGTLEGDTAFTFNTATNVLTVGALKWSDTSNLLTGGSTWTIGNDGNATRLILGATNQQWYVNSTQVLTSTTGDFNVKIGASFDSNIELSGTMRILERANHVFTPTATFGELWVRNDAPNVLVFTDDAGTDWVLNTSGGGTIGGSITDNQIAVGATTADDIEGSAALTFNAGVLTINDATSPQIRFEDTGAAANNQNWDLQTSNEEFSLRVFNDVWGVGATAWAVTRTANNIDTFSVYATETINLANGAGIYFAERADHFNTFPAASRAELWVRNDNPNVLVFTDDFGTDWVLNTSGGGIGGSIANDQIAVGAATADDIEGAADLTWNGTTFHVAGIANFDDQINVDGTGTVTATLNGGSASNVSFIASGGTPELRFYEEDAPTDQQRWYFMAQSQALKMRAYSDDFLNSYTFFNVERSGTGTGVQVDTIDFTAETDITLTAPDVLVPTGIVNMGGVATILDLQVNGESAVSATWNGATELHYNSFSKLATTATGVTISTTLDVQTITNATGVALQFNGVTKLLTLTGGVTVTGELICDALDAGGLTVTSTLPELILNESDAALDQKNWTTAASGEILVHQVADDSLVNATTWLEVHRSGTGAGVQVDTIDFTAVTDITLAASGLTLGVSDTSTLGIHRQLTTGGLRLSGGNSESDGSNILMYGSTHASGGDLYFSAGVNTWMAWNESAGTLQISTGTGAKTLAAAWSANGFLQFHEAIAVQTGDRIYFDGGGDSHIREQSADLVSFTVGGSLSWQASSTAITIYDNLISVGEAGFAASTTARPSFNVAEGVAPTTPVDGDFWITAAGEANMRLNGVTVDLAAGGGISGSIATDQVAVGSAADTIEGAATLTFDGATLTVGSVSGYAIKGASATGVTTIQSDSVTTTGAYLRMFGGSYPIFNGDILMVSTNSTVWAWDESAGIHRFNQGIGAGKTQVMALYQDTAFFGPQTGTADFTLHQGVDAAGLKISGGGENTGARITLRGGAHATLANDIAIGAGTDDDIFFWDDSFGDLQINTGTGASKTNTLNLASTLVTVQVALQVDAATDINGVLTVNDVKSGQGIMNIDSQTASSPTLQFKVNGVASSYIQHWVNNGLLLDSDNDVVIRPGNTETARWLDTGDTLLGYGTQAADGDHDVILFSNAAGTAAQSGSFRSKLTLFGGASQTRTLEFFQVESGNAFINSNYTLNVLEVTGFAETIFEGDVIVGGDQLYLGTEKDVYFQRGNINYIDVRNDGGAGTVMGLRFYDQATLSGYVYASGSTFGFLNNASSWAIQVDAEVRLYHSGTEKFNTYASGVAIPQGQRIALDGGSDTFIDSPVSNEIEFTMGNVTTVTFTSAGIEWQGQAYGNQQTLTQATTIAWNCNIGMSAVTTMTGNRTLGAPTNQKAGATYLLRIIQDATGGRTLAYNAAFKFPGGTAPVLSTGANDIDLLTCVSDGSNMYCVLNKDFT